MPHSDPEVRKAYHAAYQKRNRERVRELGKKWKNENRERVRELGREYYYRHSEKMNAYAVKWMEENRERHLAARRDRRKLNGEKIRAKDRAYNSTRRELLALKARQRLEKNRDAINARRRELRKLNPEQKRQKDREYHERYKDQERVRRLKRYREKHHLVLPYMLAHNAKRRALEKERTVDFESVKQFYQFVKNEVRIRCHYCKTMIAGKDTHIDHIIPLTKGGLHCVDNLCVSCRPCNISKNNRTPEEWRASKSTLLPDAMKGGY
jgi:5-methylcytosine-specific restriction endonuclease McrA